MRSDIVPGAVFPDYELSDHRGTRRTLSELQQGDPLVIMPLQPTLLVATLRHRPGSVSGIRWEINCGPEPAA